MFYYEKSDASKFVIPDEWRVSKYFLGGRFLKEDKYERMIEKSKDTEYIRKQLTYMFEEYIEKLDYEDREISILFVDYMAEVFQFALAKNLNFSKTTCLIEIAFHVYKESFEKKLSSDRSYEYLKKVLVRHALFRPPISILVLDLEDIQAINDFFLDVFYAHYHLYFFANTPFVNVEIRSFSMFRAKFPFADVIADAKPIPRTSIPLL